MAFTDVLKNLSDLVEQLKTGKLSSVMRTEYLILAELMVSMLTDGVAVVGNFVLFGDPYPPVSLTVYSENYDQIIVRWTAAFGDSNQIIERSEDGGVVWDVLDDALAIGLTEYTDTDVVPETTYMYRVRAVQTVAHSHEKKAVFKKDGDITANISGEIVFLASHDGSVKRIGFALGETGVDVDDPLSLEMAVKINGVLVSATAPSLDQTALDGATTFVAGTGVTVGVLAGDDSENFVVGDTISIDFTLTRTTPGTEMADLVATVDYIEGDIRYSVYSNEVTATTPAAP